jgi:hypothetical protein
MSKKTNFNLDRAINRVSKPNIFDRIVKEIDAKEIPAKYVDQVLVQYLDGTVVELNGDDITHPIPLQGDISWEDLDEVFKRMKDVRIFVNTDRLEEDINRMVEDSLGKYC